MLEATKISVRAGKTILLHETSVAFAPGRFHVIMGPNGAGKSTLLKALAGELKPATGELRVAGRHIDDYTALELARRRAVLSQQYELAFPMPVRDVVALGRFPHAGALSRIEEEALLTDCLEAMDVGHLAERDYSTLSGGEAQKVQMSRVLAQLGGAEAEGRILLLDEPVAHLDVRYQHALLAAARALCVRGNTVIAVLHDPNLALRYADRLLFLKGGRIVADLEDPLSISADLVQQVFEVPVRLLRDDGRPVLVF